MPRDLVNEGSTHGGIDGFLYDAVRYIISPGLKKDAYQGKGCGGRMRTGRSF